MRRGLLTWSKDEVPEEALDERVARAQRAMAHAGLDALLIYTNFPRPSAVSYLTHFVPYWNQGALVVPREGQPALFVALSKRVLGWVASTAHVAETVATPQIGRDAGRWLAGKGTAIRRLGVVELDAAPRGILEPFEGEIGRAEIVDASDVFALARAHADAVEIAQTRTAAEIAATAMAAARDSGAGTSSELLAAAERVAREAAAEEMIALVAPDLSGGDGLRRIEGEARLGPRYGLQLSVAYKGYWVRLARSLARAAEAEARWDAVEGWARDAATALGGGADLDAPPEGAQGVFWCVERPLGGQPLTTTAWAGGPAAQPAHPSVANVSLRLTMPEGGFVFAEPVLTGATPDEATTSLMDG